MDSHSELNITEIFRILGKRIYIFLILFIIVFWIALLVTFLLPPTYKASAKLIIQNDNNLYPAGIMPSTTEDNVFLNTQKEIMTSSFIVNTALKDLKSKGLLKEFDYYEIKRRLFVNYLTDSNLLEVNAYLNKQNEAVELANAIVEEFVNYHANAKAGLVDRKLNILKKELAVLKTNIDDLTVKLNEFGDKEQLNFYQAQIPYYVGNILDLNNKNLSTQALVQRMKDELKRTNTAMLDKNFSFYYPSLPNPPGDNTGGNPTSSLTTVPWMQDLKKKIIDAQSNLSRLIVEYTENNPEVMGLRSQITLLQKSLDEELKKVLLTYTDYYNGYIRFLESQMKSGEIEKTRYESELSQLAKNIDKAASRQIEFNALLKNYDIIQNIYAVLLQKQNDLEVLKEHFSSADLPNIQILELASLPLKKTSPNLPLNLFLGTIFGIFIGVSGSLIEEKKEYSKMKQKLPIELLAQDRRCMARARKAFVVVYELKEKAKQAKYYATSENISGSGINIRLKDYLPKGLELFLEIHITEKDFVYATGKIVWIAASETRDMFDVGLHFVKIDLQEREKLINYLYGESYVEKV